MISQEKLDQTLTEMELAGGRKLLLFSTEGELCSGKENSEELSESVRMFAGFPSASQVLGEWIYFRVELHGETVYVLLCGAEDETEHSYAIGRMALCHIRDLFLTEPEPENRVSVFRQIIEGEIPGDKAAERCLPFKMRPFGYLLFVIQYKGYADTILLETLKNLFANSPEDFLIEMDEGRTVLFKDPEEMGGMDPEQYANAIVDNLQSEAMTSVRVGYGSPAESFDHLKEAYQNACTALQIGMVFYAEERVFYYQELGIGRLIYKLPPDQCEIFLEEVLGENKEIDLDDEMMNTIRKFFENNLNITDTARQLYIHRNTLVYRLERIEKKLGLDIRVFEDAMLFRIAMMVRLHLNEMNVEK